MDETHPCYPPVSHEPGRTIYILLQHTRPPGGLTWPRPQSGAPPLSFGFLTLYISIFSENQLTELIFLCRLPLVAWSTSIGFHELAALFSCSRFWDLYFWYLRCFCSIFSIISIFLFVFVVHAVFVLAGHRSFVTSFSHQPIDIKTVPQIPPNVTFSSCTRRSGVCE